MKVQMEQMTAGNRLQGDCHCIHVTYLNDRLVDLEALVSRMRTGGHQGRDTQGAHGADAQQGPVVARLVLQGTASQQHRRSGTCSLLCGSDPSA